MSSSQIVGFKDNKNNTFMSLGRMFLNKINHNRVLFTIMRENLQFSFIVLFWATDCTFLVLLMVSAAPSWGPRTSARRRRWQCATLARRSGSSAPSCLRWKSFAPSWRRRQSSDTSTPELTPPRCWPTGSSIILKVFLSSSYWYDNLMLTFILTQYKLEVLVGYTIFWIVKTSRGPMTSPSSIYFLCWKPLSSRQCVMT